MSSTSLLDEPTRLLSLLSRCMQYHSLIVSLDLSQTHFVVNFPYICIINIVLSTETQTNQLLQQKVRLSELSKGIEPSLIQPTVDHGFRSSTAITSLHRVHQLRQHRHRQRSHISLGYFWANGSNWRYPCSRALISCTQVYT